MKFKKPITIVLILFLILCLTSCAPAGATEHVYGFFGGFWHGFIATFSLIVYWFFDIGIWAATNTGLTYYIGCGIGMIIMCILSYGRL